MSVNKILEMADKGELQGMEQSLDVVRGWAAKPGLTRELRQQQNLPAQMASPKIKSPAPPMASYRALSAQEEHDQENEDLDLVKLVREK